MIKIKKTIERIIFILFLFLSISGATVIHAEGTYTHTESFSTDHEMIGLFASAQEYFQAGEWDVKEIKLNLFYTVTELAIEKISNFTVYLNDQPVYSSTISLTAGETKELNISIPADLLKEGSNNLEVDSYIRINDDDPCIDDVSTANWMILSKESYIFVTYTPLTICKSISDVYKQMTSIEGLENEESAVFLPKKATDTELSASAMVLSGMSKNASLYYNKLELKKAKNMAGILDKTYALYLSEYDNLLPEIKKILTSEQVKAAKESAVIVYLNPAKGKNLLVVAGKNKESLLNAARLLGNAEYSSQIKRTWKRISETETVSFKASKEDMSYLTSTGSYVKGPFRHSMSFAVSVGQNQLIAAGSEVVLRFRYAENLDFTRSLVTIFAGDTPLGSKKLEKVNAGADVLRVSIPDNLELNGDFTLQVTFDLEMIDYSCTMRRQEMPWAYVTNESTVSLVTKEIPYLLFDYYPGPFIKEGRFNEVVIVLPTEEEETDLEAMREILLTMGRYLKDNSGNIRVCRSDNLDNVESSNIISIGCYSENVIARQLNDNMYFQFNSEGTSFRSNEKMKIEPNYGVSLGTIQLLYSPYGKKNCALLIVSGVKPEGMLDASSYLGDADKLWQMYGDGMVADSEQIYCYRFGMDNSKQTSFFNRLMEQKDLMLLFIIGGSVLFLLLLSSVLLYHKQRKK